MTKTQNLTLTALLALLIAISGSMKIPALAFGAEFQLSAPIAVAIAAVFGFKRYIIAGCIASLLSLLLGMATLPNILIAMCFRVAVGAIFALFGVNKCTLITAGGCGTAFARFIFAELFHLPFLPLLAGAGIGIVFTAITAPVLYRILKGLVARTAFQRSIVSV